MGCCPSAPGPELEELKRQNDNSLKALQEYAREQRAQMQANTAAMEASLAKQQMSLDQAAKEREFLKTANDKVLAQQNEAIQMAVLQQKQQEVMLSSAAEEALKKAEALRKTTTPPPKPGKVNILVQTDRTYGPNAILKRRTPKNAEDAAKYADRDHREDCGGVGFDTVEAPAYHQVPVMVVKEKDQTNKGDDDDDDDMEGEYDYAYEYQYTYQYSKDIPEAPKAIIAPDTNIPGSVKMADVLAATPEGFQEIRKKSTPMASEPVRYTGDPEAGQDLNDDDYEYEYEDQTQ